MILGEGPASPTQSPGASAVMAQVQLREEVR
jgi:hypothetical protein